jgi:predicted lipid-binding transport protein (Tim44 family)
MNNKTHFPILVFFCLTLSLLYFWQDTAEAARLGGGRSFGSKPSYKRSAPPPAQSAPASQTNPGQTAQAKSAAGTPAAPLGGMGGMLGGLLMGGLIGSLLFGGGLGSGGAGMLDILLIGGGLFLLFRFLRARRMAAESASGGSMSFQRGPDQAWGSAGFTPSDEAPAGAMQQPVMPPGFDAEDFLKGASAIYARLQAAWDKRDLDDIRQFASPEVFMEIQQQAQEDPGPGKTELLWIDPRIIEVREVDRQIIVSVLYDVMLREKEDEMTKQVRELWHFSRKRARPEDFWVLEGIQQVEK